MLSLLRDPEFRVLTITQFLSIAGDQLARVALSVLVFARTDSALEAAVAYALTFVPAAIGGPLLSGLADRRPRRSVMIASDLARAPLIALIAIPTIPLPLAMVLLSIASIFEAPFEAARGSMLPDVLPGERYPVGYAFTQIVFQAAQVGGFGFAGVLLVIFSPSTLLLLDAATFVLSAILIAKAVRWRPAGLRAPGSHRAWWRHAASDLRTAVGAVLRVPQVRPLVLLAWWAASFAIAFEALGAPLARASGSSTWTVGLLLASQPAGTVLGVVLVARVPAPRRPSTMRALALLAMVPLVAGLLEPPIQMLVAIGLVSGIGLSFNVLASTAFVARVPAEVRGRALGFVGTGLLVGQGLGVLAAGTVANAIDARQAVGWLGLIGTLAVLFTLLDDLRSTRKRTLD